MFLVDILVFKIIALVAVNSVFFSYFVLYYSLQIHTIVSFITFLCFFFI